MLFVCDSSGILAVIAAISSSLANSRSNFTIRLCLPLRRSFMKIRAAFLIIENSEEVVLSGFVCSSKSLFNRPTMMALFWVFVSDFSIESFCSGISVVNSSSYFLTVFASHVLRQTINTLPNML